jgi:CcmD family protein
MVKRTTEMQRRAVVLVVLCAVLICVVGAAQQPQPAPQPAPPAATDEFVPISQLPPQDQLPAAPLLISAYAFVWVALFGYLLSVGRRLTKVQSEVERLESEVAKGSRT